MDRESQIDYTNVNGLTRDPFQGHVEAQDVDFAYPARPEVQVLTSFNALVTLGHTVTVVGSLGSGKSTLVALVQHFYNVLGGRVQVEGTDMCDWKLQQLCANMALVGQDPVLFDCTVADNIVYSALEGMDVSQDMIEQVAKAANIHDFVVNLPEGYQTKESLVKEVSVWAKVVCEKRKRQQKKPLLSEVCIM
jgi:ABC-type multidrug transport system fused ATPase/permease subunit